MKNSEHFDFWYAVHNTTFIKLPSAKLETFGNTMVNYYLLTELMDSANKVRVREGRIEAFRPQLIVPQNFTDDFLCGFGEEAGRYAEWLRVHEKNLHILQYGFVIKKREISQHLISDTLEIVADRVKSELEAKDDPLSALVIGVDTPWEVCLLKLMVEVSKHSLSKNFKELQHDPEGIRYEIEQSFKNAYHDPSHIKNLSHKLHEHNLFGEYEDRFFALVRFQR